MSSFVADVVNKAPCSVWQNVRKQRSSQTISAILGIESDLIRQKVM